MNSTEEAKEDPKHQQYRQNRPTSSLPSFSSSPNASSVPPSSSSARYTYPARLPPNRKIKHGDIFLPPYITPVRLAKLLFITLNKLCMGAHNRFPDWWPDTCTRRQLKKSGYSNIKNCVLNFTQAAEICSKLYKRNPHLVMMEGSDLIPAQPPRIIQRKAVISVLGHKDHGKTTLLDVIRGTNVAEKEPHQITQQIYTRTTVINSRVSSSSPSSSPSPSTATSTSTSVLFLDTPGHHSFTEMRVHCAAHSDVVVLVIAVDEGLLAQSIESLSITKQISLPVIIVLSKIDTEGSWERMKKIEEEMRKMRIELLNEDEIDKGNRTGRMVAVPVSAKTGDGIEKFKRVVAKTVSLLAKTNQLDADLSAIASGSIIESYREGKGRGNVIKVLLRSGSVHLQDYFVADIFSGRVKSLRNSEGEEIEVGIAGDCIEIMGVEGLPAPAAEFIVTSKEASRDMAHCRRDQFQWEEEQRAKEENKKNEEEEEQKMKMMETGGMERDQTRNQVEESETDASAPQLSAKELLEIRRQQNREQRHRLREDKARMRRIVQGEFVDDEISERPLGRQSFATSEEESDEIGEQIEDAEEVESEEDEDEEEKAEGESVESHKQMNMKQKSDDVNLNDYSSFLRQADRPMITASSSSLSNPAPSASSVSNFSSPSSFIPDVASSSSSDSLPPTLPYPLLIKANSVGSIRMLHDTIDRINASYSNTPVLELVECLAGPIKKSDLFAAQNYGSELICFLVGQATGREQKEAKELGVKLLHFTHHEFMLEYLRETARRVAGEPDLDPEVMAKKRAEEERRIEEEEKLAEEKRRRVLKKRLTRKVVH